MNKTFKRMFVLTAALGLGSAFAYNPISTYHYLADPGAAADDEYFYIITDSDDPAVYNASGYNIKALYGFRSKDMQNWTDFGIIYDARQINGISNIWASGIAVNPKDNKLYIVLPDGANGVAYIKADSIAGPWSNAVGGGKNKLVGGGGVTGCDGVAWCFDPGIFFDDDGTGYVTWGGGDNASRPNTDNFDVMKLNSSYDGFTGNAQHVKVNGLPTRKMLEASYIHKYKGTYYFSYSTGWQQGAPSIDYATGSSPMGPFTWKGTILEDPSMNGKSINGNNNHHGIAEFKGHSYVVYHDRRIAKGHDGLEIIPADDGQPKPNEGYHRSVSVDEMFYNADGTIKKVVCTNEGPEQLENFDPYDWYPALTSSKQKGVRSRSLWAPGKVAGSILLPLASRSESWIRVSGVDFGSGATGFTVEAASTADNNKIEIHKGSADGALAGTCSLAKTSSKTDYVETSCDIEGLSGIVDHIFLVFKGSQDSTMAIKAWGFEGSGTTEPTPHSPYEGVAAKVPGKIEAEHYDVPGAGRGSDAKSYKDDDSKNQGDADFRTENGVDIVLGGTGMAIGYTSEGEWLLYTIDVTADGEYAIKASASTGAESAGFKFQIDDKDVGSEVVVAQTGEDWSVYKEFSAGSVALTAGTHVVKLVITGTNVNVDWFSIGDVSSAPVDVNPVPSANDSNATIVPGDDSTSVVVPDDSSAVPSVAIGKYNVRFDVPSSNIYNVFSMNGKKLGAVDLTGYTAAEALSIAGFGKGVYMLKKVRGFKKMVVNSAK